jgi:hypothetical protein
MKYKQTNKKTYKESTKQKAASLKKLTRLTDHWQT